MPNLKKSPKLQLLDTGLEWLLSEKQIRERNQAKFGLGLGLWAITLCEGDSFF
jgi:hypothetical protein